MTTQTKLRFIPGSFVIIILVFFLPLVVLGQTGSYIVTKAPFSSDEYDEFSPVYYMNGLVFTTNRSSGMSSYTDSRNKSPFSLSYIDTTHKVKWSNAILFSKEIESKLNDGPATFSVSGDTIYYSRNQNIDLRVGKLLGTRNKLGIYYAVLNDGKWGNVKEFRFNIEYYNVTTPFISPDGKRLYFSSDQPGGFGGADLYYSPLKNGYWDTPVNLGPNVNTEGNESYPFINKAGQLFFSSDGHKGLGGKDIFVTRQNGSGWFKPERLEEPVNSESDDFGLITDALMSEGYFSSSREKSVDIFKFRSNKFNFWFSEAQKEKQYCFSVSDTGSIVVDSLRFRYVWDFGDGSKASGRKAVHCYPGPGNYRINLDILDAHTGALFFRKRSIDVEVRQIAQPYITTSDVALRGESLELDGLKSSCPGYQVIAYHWDFSDGNYATGEKVKHTFDAPGNYTVRMGLTLKDKQTGDLLGRVVSKKIRVANTAQEKASFLKAQPGIGEGAPDIRRAENFTVKDNYSAEADLRKAAVFRVVVLSSPTKLSPGNAVFRKVPQNYTVREVHDEGGYSYVVDEQLDLLSVYNAYSDIKAAGFSAAAVKLHVLENAAEKQLHVIKKKYGILTDGFFEGTRLLTNGILMLNSVVSMMNDNPEVKLEVRIHTDNQPTNTLWQTQVRAQTMVDYLVSSGIERSRLVAKGYGGVRPVASNSSAAGRTLNRRVELIIK